MVNEWTRDDLPRARDTTVKFRRGMGSLYFPAVDAYADAVVAHLNREHPKTNIAPSGMSVNAALSDIARERDAAVALAEAAERALVEARVRAEADARYSGDPNHAFVEGALWATRHVLGQEASDE